MDRLFFASDYQEGAHPSIMKRLMDTNFDRSPGYGTDEITASAKEKIRAACACPDAAVYFLVGGTQTNATVIDSVLHSYQGVVAADTGHISTHEAGAIEAGGHKVLTLPHHFGKIDAEQIEGLCSTFWGDGNHEHMVMPGMVYLSQPTEYGTLYSLAELTAISRVCRKYDMKLYVDGARLAYALACPENDVALEDLARLCDVFYIGGTKCAALFGEAVVIPDPKLIPHFFTIIKQHGALFAKGRILGIQFDELFTDDLYMKVGQSAVEEAAIIKEALIKAGYQLTFDTPTNQIFITLEDAELERLSKTIEFSFWEKADDTHTVVRVATSWATRREDTHQLLQIMCSQGA